MYDHYRARLDGAHQRLYDWLYPQLLHRVPRMEVPGWPTGSLEAVLRAIVLDRPELSHFPGLWSYDGGIVPRYRSGCGPLTAPPPEYGDLSARDLYRRLASDVTYDLTAPNSQTAWGALVDRRAVCKGLARGYQLCCRSRGIPCILVEGTLDGTGRHAWNLVFDRDRWIQVDVTMAYPAFSHFVPGKEDPGFDFAPQTAAHRPIPDKAPQGL